MADDWDEDDWEAAPPVPVRSGGATGAPPRDDWEDEDEGVDEVEAAVALAVQKPAAPMKQAKRLAQALKEKEAQEKEASRQRAVARERELAEMSSAARKLEMQRMVEAADLDNARDLFGANGANPADIPAGDNLHTFEPKTEQELAKYAVMLTDKCRKFNSDPRRTTRYVAFVKEVVRGLTTDLSPDDAKELATHMSTISNLKLEEFKKSKGGGKKKTSKKTAVRVDRNDDMLDGAFNDGYDNDDFM